MTGLKLIAEPVVVADRALVEELITLPLETSGKAEFRAGVSSRSRVLADYDFPQNEKEKNLELDFYLEPGACVDIFHVLKDDAAATNLSVVVRYHLKKHATLNVWTYVGAGDFVRFEQQILFKEEHGFASLRGLSVLGEKSQVVNKVQADHTVGHCISRQFFKSIVSGQARSGFESLVSVAKGAVKSDSKQLNKNLVLSSEARCSSRPELRIHTDDVSAAHGSATGELSPEELFYLRSRGISKDQARLMMIEGFAAEVVEEVSYTPLKERLREMVRQRTDELTTRCNGG